MADRAPQDPSPDRSERARRIEQMRGATDRGFGLWSHDAVWLLDELAAADARVTELEGELKELRREIDELENMRDD